MPVTVGQLPGELLLETLAGQRHGRRRRFTQGPQQQGGMGTTAGLAAHADAHRLVTIALPEIQQLRRQAKTAAQPVEARLPRPRFQVHEQP